MYFSIPDESDYKNIQQDNDLKQNGKPSISQELCSIPLASGLTAAVNSIGAAVLGNATKVAIGNGKAAVITPALAFDAGFTAAYQEKGDKAPIADAQQLKTLAEGCLGQRGDPGACYSAGYVYGIQAVKGQIATGH